MPMQLSAVPQYRRNTASMCFVNGKQAQGGQPLLRQFGHSEWANEFHSYLGRGTKLDLAAMDPLTYSDAFDRKGLR